MARRIGSTVVLVVIAFISIFLDHGNLSAAAAKQSAAGKITISVQSSSASSLYSTLVIVNPKLANQVLNAKKEAAEGASLYSDIEVALDQGQRQSKFRVDRSGFLWERRPTDQWRASWFSPLPLPNGSNSMRKLYEAIITDDY
ncbi:hypothetical protein [Cohnella cholangitidis]|uniref:Uncharacterized protein n=1 Tax=Cohnella cholangitidis TaxID=2598458 RepID=A0A7G5BSK0_9BACL|nr:hypothetical protein [Cohnella cholangitidis]QMV39934.1 hypothetical protein FPL14_00985 [Cohnella cholangitidis]